MEKKYFKVLNYHKYNILFLYSIEISEIKDKKYKKKFKEIVKLLRPEELVILSSCSIYNMTEYFKIKNIKS